MPILFFDDHGGVVIEVSDYLVRIDVVTQQDEVVRVEAVDESPDATSMLRIVARTEGYRMQAVNMDGPSRLLMVDHSTTCRHHD